MGRLGRMKPDINVEPFVCGIDDTGAIGIGDLECR